ncbi:putative C-type lectin domain family 20 member A [Betta splendens]|uniref:C-type lectin domain family 20 member A n=1 Tax=Betta splendens TaxID=158456 RepID=A0A6P7M0F6_BETSP|nr:putative C-type lectin domain family 20 member A [Betta splendens]
MQGRVSSLFFFLLPELLRSKYSSLQITNVVPVFEPRSWAAAQRYCRQDYTDLASLLNTSQYSKVDPYEGWIGFFMTSSEEWKWSVDSDDLPASDVDWCLFKNLLTWEVDDCSQQHPFLCEDDRLILVQEATSWEEALRYCRALQAVGPTRARTTSAYDLVSLPDPINILLNVDAATQEVWVGLRFLADEWMWLSGDPVTIPDLPDCPDQNQRCGALDPNNSEWKTLDCSERRSFICSTYTKHSERKEF